MADGDIRDDYRATDDGRRLGADDYDYGWGGVLYLNVD